MLELIKEPWPWYVSGPMIAGVMFLMLWFGKSFGVSSTLRTMCTIGGAGKWNPFFAIDWRAQVWNLVFVLGAFLGGYIATNYLTKEGALLIQLSESTVAQLQAWGFAKPGEGYLPATLFSWEALWEGRGFLFLVVGGFMVGFGARYAGGCTSGHAISGLSDLQLQSLYAVIGFFMGGLFMVYVVYPYLFA